VQFPAELYTCVCMVSCSLKLHLFVSQTRSESVIISEFSGVWLSLSLMRVIVSHIGVVHMVIVVGSFSVSLPTGLRTSAMVSAPDWGSAYRPWFPMSGSVEGRIFIGIRGRVELKRWGQRIEASSLSSLSLYLFCSAFL